MWIMKLRELETTMPRWSDQLSRPREEMIYELFLSLEAREGDRATYGFL